MLKKASEYELQCAEFLDKAIEDLEAIFEKEIQKSIGESMSYCNHEFYEANSYIWAGGMTWEKNKINVCVYYYNFYSKEWIPTSALLRVIEKLTKLDYGVSFSTEGITIKINFEELNERNNRSI